MTIRRYKKDPRTATQKRADREVLRAVESGAFLRVSTAVERAAIEHVRGRREERRDVVATLGRELGVLRRAHGLTQEEVARAVGTNKSNISRIESGRYGGLTIERFIALLEAFQALGPLGRRKSA